MKKVNLKDIFEQAKKSIKRQETSEYHDLIIKGQGVISVKKFTNREDVIFSFFDTSNQKGIKLEIAKKEIEKVVLEKNGEKKVEKVKIEAAFYRADNLNDNKLDWTLIADTNRPGSGIDLDSDCKYWLSIDSHNCILRYGKGEIRKGCSFLEYDYNTEDLKEKLKWIKEVSRVKLDHATKSTVYRDPVVNEVPLYVVPIDQITIDDIARGTKTSSGSLSKENQVLFQTVAGPKFELNTEDFPYFVQAIEESIQNKDGWCYKRLQEKANEFGGNNINETYLRITLGLNGGESPGVPFVIEIWPPGHYSPIHNHGNSNAVIKVLNGEITVNLYRMLSGHHVQPFSVAKFSKGDVTYITPQVNQVHQLRNTNVIGPTCITIQCYLYGDSDSTHYEFFDYLDENGTIKHFDPDSDMDYLLFKQTMKKEWSQNHNF